MTTPKILTAFVVAAVIAPVMGSCSKDDAPDGPNSSLVSDIDGTRVTTIGNTEIKYDDNGRAYRFIDSYGYEIMIDYSNKKLCFSDSDYDESDDMDIKFNGDGFITELSSSWNEKDEGYEYKGSGKITFSYDKNDCLTKMYFKSSETEKDLSDNSTSQYSEESTLTFNWNNGNLTSMNCNEIEIEDGDRDTYNFSTTVDYGSVANKFRQFPMSLLYVVGGDYDLLFAVGLMGNGPVNLPERITISEEGEGSYPYDIDFTLNDNGSIASEYGPITVNYGYSAISRANMTAGRMFRLTPRSFFKGVKKH